MGLRRSIAVFVAAILFVMGAWGMHYYKLNYSNGFYQPLQLATARGDVQRIRHLVKEESFRVSKYTLGIAVSYSRMESLRVFIEELGIDVNTPGIGDETVLMHAAEELRPNFVEYLLSQGANPNAQDNSGERPLFSAVKNAIRDEYTNAEVDRANQLRIVEMLVQAGAEIDANGGAVLDEAVINDDLQLAAYLLRSGADANAAKKGAHGPLVLATSREMAELLLLHGADLHQTDDEGESVLQFVIRYADDTEVVRSLLEHGADLCHRNLKGHSVWDRIEGNDFFTQKDDETTKALQDLLLEFEKRQGKDCGWSISGNDASKGEVPSGSALNRQIRRILD